MRQAMALAALLSGKRHFSYPLIVETRELAINIMDASMVDAVYGCGTTTGRTVADKFGRFDLHREEADQIAVPLVAEAVANVECRVRDLVDLDTSSLIIADIVAVFAILQYIGLRRLR